MQLPKLSAAAFAGILLVFSTACDQGSPTETEPTSQPWTVQFTFGNTFINSAPVTTHQDGVSANILTDYVNASALPNTQLEWFTTHAYIPTDGSVNTRISGVRIQAARTDGSSTPNFYRSSEYVQQSRIAGQSYDVYRMDGLYLGSPALTPHNFANVNFTFTVEYLSSTGAVLHSSLKTIEIYKR